MTDDLVDYDPQDYPEAVSWAKERAKELRRRSEQSTVLNTTNADLHSYIRELEVENAGLKAQLDSVDATLARRPALAKVTDRLAKVERACSMAGRAERAEAKVEHLHEVLEQNAAELAALRIKHDTRIVECMEQHGKLQQAASLLKDKMAELAALKAQPKDALHEELAMQVREMQVELAALKADVVYDDAGDHVQTWKTHAIVLDAENTQLKTYLERARTYKGVEAYACPLCTYKNGIFIEQCQMHKDIQDLEREWRQAKAECTQLYAIEHWARETIEGDIDASSQGWMRLKDALDRWKEKHET